MTDFGFVKTTMPKTREADYHLGCLDGAVFLDFNQDENRRIYLRRISFDGWGCYSLPHHHDLNYDTDKALDTTASKQFRHELKSTDFQETFYYQDTITDLVLQLITLNQDGLDKGSLRHYGLLDCS